MNMDISPNNYITEMSFLTPFQYSISEIFTRILNTNNIILEHDKIINKYKKIINIKIYKNIQKKKIITILNNLNTNENINNFNKLKNTIKNSNYSINKYKSIIKNLSSYIPKKKILRMFSKTSTRTRTIKYKYRQQTGGEILNVHEILKTWHLFDKQHDFNIPYSDEMTEFTSYTTNPILINLFTKSFSENKVVTDLLEHVYRNNDKIDKYLLYVKIRYTKNEFEIYDYNRELLQIQSIEVPNKLKEFIFNSRNPEYIQDTAITNMKIKGDITGDINDNDEDYEEEKKSKSISWRLFEENILNKIAIKKNPYEKTWDPLGSHINICDENYEENIKRINVNYNKINVLDEPRNINIYNNDYENYFAFRNLTIKYFNISFKCNNNNYEGIEIILKKINGPDKLQDLNEKMRQYMSAINTYNRQIKDIFNFGIDNDKFKCIIKNNGFSIDNIKTTISLIEDNLNNIHRWLLNGNIINEIKKIGKKKSKDNFINKTLILLLISFVYIYPSINEDNKNKIFRNILYDLKKSGDWGQVLYCYYNNLNEKKSCFISGDKYSAFYSILHNIPTIFSSITPNNYEEKYNELMIYPGRINFNFNYVKSSLLNYLDNEIIRNIKINIFNQNNAIDIDIINNFNVDYQNLRNDIETLFKTNVYSPYSIEINDYVSPDSITNLDKINKEIFKFLKLKALKIIKKYVKLLNLLKDNLDDVITLEEYQNVKNLNFNDLYERFKFDIKNNNILKRNQEISYEMNCINLLNYIKNILDTGFNMLYIIYIFYYDNKIYKLIYELNTRIIKSYENTIDFFQIPINNKTRLGTRLLELEHYNVLKEYLESCKTGNEYEIFVNKFKNLFKYANSISSIFDITNIKYKLINDIIVNNEIINNNIIFKNFVCSVIVPKINNAFTIDNTDILLKFKNILSEIFDNIKIHFENHKASIKQYSRFRDLSNEEFTFEFLLNTIKDKDGLLINRYNKLYSNLENIYDILTNISTKC